jgi:hypothetical protein
MSWCESPADFRCAVVEVEVEVEFELEDGSDAGSGEESSRGAGMM